MLTEDTMRKLHEMRLTVMARTLREQLRAMEKAQLNDVAHGADTDEEFLH